MGLFKNIKNILFDEEEDYTSQIKITPEMRNEEVSTSKEDKPQVKKIEQVPVQPAPVKKEEAINFPKEPSERETFKNDSTFPFLDLDEDEFNSYKPMRREEKKQETPTPQPRNTNVFEYEKRKRLEKRTDYGRYEKTEITETVERKKFKPSPIISPVYGVLNQDYKKDDIIKRENSDELDVQKVRNKAFGEKNITPAEIKEQKPVKPSYYEEEETVTITIPEEKEKKVKTIDELLEDTSDIVVDIDRDMDIDDSEFKSEIKRDDTESKTKSEFKEPDVENDTLENDLFDLIDSMYDEDGE